MINEHNSKQRRQNDGNPHLFGHSCRLDHPANVGIATLRGEDLNEWSLWVEFGPDGRTEENKPRWSDRIPSDEMKLP